MNADDLIAYFRFPYNARRSFFFLIQRMFCLYSIYRLLLK
jgi:hypothetical protein